MKLEFSEQEVARAVAFYASSKVNGTKADDFTVVMRWRGRTAEVTRNAPAPVLTERIQRYEKVQR